MKVIICKNYNELNKFVKNKNIKVKSIVSNGTEAGQYTYLVLYRKKFLGIF